MIQLHPYGDTDLDEHSCLSAAAWTAEQDGVESFARALGEKEVCNDTKAHNLRSQ